MFTAAGPIQVNILDVKFAEPKFAKGPNDFDICIQVAAVDAPDQTDWWRGEWSDNYGQGNVAHLKQTELTMQTLRKIGFEGDDLTTLPEQLIGQTTTAMIKAREHNGNTYYDVKYLGSGGGNAPVELDPNALKQRLAAFNATAADEPDNKPRPAAKPAGAKSAVNPFAK